MSLSKKKQPDLGQKDKILNPNPGGLAENWGNFVDFSRTDSECRRENA